MSLLVVQIPPRPRLRSAAPAGADDGARASTEFAYVLSSDGLASQRQGLCAPSLLPKADTVVAVLAENDVSWHRVNLPRAPANRLRAALSGLLEEALLDETEHVHLALAPQPKAGEPTWIAACDHRWLATELATLERAGVRVDRVAPSAWPDEPSSGHFHELSAEAGEQLNVALTWSHGNGVATWPLQGGLAHALLPQPLPETAGFTATPAVAAPAERWLGATVAVVSPGERALAAARSLWNLRQFGLAPRHRGADLLRARWRQFLSPAWRPARVGLLVLVLMQIVGLNLWAWQQKAQIASRRAAMNALLTTTYPQVRTVYAAPEQMQKETELLRTAAGQPG
ncbi:MAG TPA: type II secretion system protein GspL, partial [Methylibium sp.]